MADHVSTPESLERIAAEIDTSVPHSARFWNYLLGGEDHFPPDREVGDYIMANMPGLVEVARCSRRFLVRAVHYLAAEGIRQFLDIGTGLPTSEHVHEVAQRAAPECRIVYVDNDPLVLAHARALLVDTPEGRTDCIDADLRNPDAIVEAAAATLDLTRPVALVLTGIIGHIADFDEAKALVRRLLAALPSGSFLVHCDGTNTSPQMVEAEERYINSGAVPYYVRSPEQIRQVFDGLELVEPGVVPVTRWRPEAGQPGESGGPADVDACGGVGRKA